MTVVAGRFEIERLAASGGMGMVYRALDRHTGDVVALKLLSSPGGPFSERFAREAQLLAELTHPAIVRYVAHGTTPEGEAYIAMEWLDGEDLSQRLQRKGLTVGESMRLGARVAHALGVAHARSVVHRDIKPSNVFLVGGSVDQVKV